MHKDKQTAAVNGKGSSSTAGDAAAERDSTGVVHSMGQYDPQADRFVSSNRYGTGEEQLAIRRAGSAGAAARGAEWGLLQLDLSVAWRLPDEPVENVREMLEQAAGLLNC